MKKVFYLVPGDSSYKYPIGNAFKRIGWQVRYFDYRKGNLPIRIFRFLPWIGGFEKADKEINNKIISICKEYKPDIILTAKGEKLSENLMKSIKHSENITVDLFPDYLNHWPTIKEISLYYDYFFTFDKATIKKLQHLGRKNIRFLPQATEPEWGIRMNKVYDVSFIGTYNPWREEYLSVLKRFNLNIWGDKRWYRSALVNCTRGGRVSLKEMKKIIKQTKINLNIFFDNKTIIEGVSLRPYEITGSGGFLLSQFVKGYKDIFIEDREMVSFKSPKEMVEKVRFYLNDDKNREMIAEQGYRRTLQEHTYTYRIMQLLKIIGM